MDYYTPVAKRKMSFKEFMLEWIVHHHERTMKDYGLAKPWFWDTFLQCLDHGHHAMHLGTWFWRPTLFWKPNAGVSKAERKWLNEKYPSWEDSWGVLWDEIIANVNRGEMAQTYPETLPALCNITQLPLGSAWDRHHLKMYTSEYKGRLYNFDSDVSKWIFDSEPERYAGHTNVVDRFLLGQIQPMNLAGGLQWMGITPEVMGDDAYAYRWAADYAQPEPQGGLTPRIERRSSMALFPIYGVFEGDFVPHLVAVDTDDTMNQVAEKIAVHSVGRRVPRGPRGAAYRIQVGERTVANDQPLSQVIADTGLKPLRVDHGRLVGLSEGAGRVRYRSTSFVEVCAVDDLWIGEMECFDVGAAEVLILNVDGQLHAYDGICPAPEHAAGRRPVRRQGADLPRPRMELRCLQRPGHQSEGRMPAPLSAAHRGRQGFRGHRGRATD